MRVVIGSKIRWVGVLLALHVGQQASAGMAEALLVRYSFNEGRGGEAADDTGFGTDAALHGDATFADNNPWGGNAKFGHALTLDGAGDYAVVGSGFHNQRLQSETIGVSAWVRPAAAGSGRQTIVSKHSATAQTGFALSIDAVTGFLHGQVFVDGVSAAAEVFGRTTIPNNTWSHIAMTFDGQSLAVFVDGVSDGVVSLGSGHAIASSALDPLTIGASLDATLDSEFSGLIDEVRLYSTLDASGVAALASAPGGEPGLVFYESFDSISHIWVTGTFSDLAGVNDADLVAGPFGNALHMQNAGEEDELLSWPMAGRLNPDKGHISFWYAPDDGPDRPGGTIMETEDSGAGGGIRIYRWNNAQNDVQFRLYAQGTYLISQNQEPAVAESWQAGQWHHLELIWDLTAATPYMAYIVDGEIGNLKTDGILPFNPDLADPLKLHIGSRHTGSGMKGAIDELKIWAEPQYDVFSYAERIAAYHRANRRDGMQQPHETVHNSADAAWPDATLASADPITFYQVAPFQRVYAGNVPAGLDVADRLSYAMARNDTESLFFNVYSQVDASDVLVTLGDLRDSTGVIAVAAEDMSLRVVKNWWQRTADDRQAEPYFPVWVPELLMYDDRYNFKHDDYDTGPEASHTWDNLPSFPAPASAQVSTEFTAFTSKQFMAGLTLPHSLVAGVYTIDATVTGAGISGSRVVTLEVNVRDLVLPEADKSFSIYHRAQYLGAPTANGGKDAVPDRDYYLAELRDMRAHGLNAVFAYGTDLAYVSDLAGEGFDGHVIFPYAGITQGAGAAQDLSDALSAAFGEAYFAGIDEPANNQELEWQMSRAANVHQYGKIANAIYLPWADCLTNPHRLRPDPNNGDAMTDFCPYSGSETLESDEHLDLENLSVSNQTLVNGVRPTQAYFANLLAGTIAKDGAQQIYYWQSRDEDARVNRYYAGLHLFLTDLAGIQPYVYIHNNGTDPYDDLDGCPCNTIREMNTVYPTAEGPMSTIEWEALREGIDDYRYLQLWASLYGTLAAADAGLAAASKARVDAVLLPYRNGLAAVRESVSNADFDATRAVVAAEIADLQHSLADGDGDGAANHADNCVAEPNPSQTDNDSDGAGNACDSDDDDDGVADTNDNCSLVVNPGQEDTDGDGAGNACDTVVDAPVIADISPSRLATGATVVTVSGEAFQPGVAVAVTSGRKVRVTEVRRIDFRTLEVSVSVRKGAKGTRTLRVTNPDMQSDTRMNAITIVK